MKNTQTAQTDYPLMEDFYTLQGEGFHTGQAAYFIRLAGCDVGCVWCDVKGSWSVEQHPRVSIKEIIERVKKSKSNIAVITGGEPALYNLKPLTEALSAINVKCFIETSGAYPLTGEWDWVCVSPKKFKGPLIEVLEKANELKVIVYNSSDFDWAEKHALKVNKNCKLFLQPEYSVFEKVMPSIVEYVKANNKWKVSLQTHKVMNIP